MKTAYSAVASVITCVHCAGCRWLSYHASVASQAGTTAASPTHCHCRTHAIHKINETLITCSAVRISSDGGFGTADTAINVNSPMNKVASTATDVATPSRRRPIHSHARA